MTDAAWSEARRLGHHWVGAEHILLGLVRDGEESLAARALRECGEMHGAIEARLVAGLANMRPRFEARPGETPRPNPRAYQMLGRAEGLAAAAGSREVSPEHLLVALLWDPVAPLGFGAGRRRAVLERLRELGGDVPAAELPPDDMTVWGDDVDVPYDRLMEVVGALPAALPEGARFGFNHDGEDEAWVVAEAGVDLEPIVERILASA